MPITIYSHIKHPPRVSEKKCGPSKVEKAGYLPIQRRISDMLGAGQRLMQARKEQFDTHDNKDIAVDPTRRPGFDDAELNNYASVSDIEQDCRLGKKRRSEKPPKASENDQPTNDPSKSVASPPSPDKAT